jgi:hypothetical protein
LFDNVRLPHHCAQSESVIDSVGKNSQLEMAKPAVRLMTFLLESPADCPLLKRLNMRHGNDR